MGRTRSGGSNYAQLRRPALRRALRPHARARERRRARRADRRDARHPRARAPVDRVFHREDYALNQPLAAARQAVGDDAADGEVSRPRSGAARAELRTAWNQPVRWPAYALVAALAAFIAPGAAPRLARGPAMIAYLVRRLLFGAVTRRRRAAVALRALLSRRHAGRHRAQGDGREGAAGGAGAVEDRRTATTSRASGTRHDPFDTMLVEHLRRMLTFDFGRSDADDTPISDRLRSGVGPEPGAHRAAVRHRRQRWPSRWRCWSPSCATPTSTAACWC